MKTTYLSIGLASVLLASCGGGSGDNNNDGTSLIETDTPELSVGGAGNELTCENAFSFKDHSEERKDRTDKLCDLANILYLDKDSVDSPTVSFNADFKDTGEDYIGGTKVHTGIDIQGSGSLLGSRIGSLSNGIVEAIHQSHGNVVVRTMIEGVGSRGISYMHLSDIEVVVGQEVNVGTVLGDEDKVGLGAEAGKHLHLELLTYQYSKVVANYIPTDQFTWGDSTSDGALIDILDIADILTNEPTRTSASNPLISAYIPTQWIAGQEHSFSGIAEASDGVQFEVINTFSNVVYQSQVFYPPSMANGFKSLNPYVFGSEDEFDSLPSGNYVLRVNVINDGQTSFEDYPFYLTQNDPDIGPAPEPEPVIDTVLDLKLDRDTYMYFGSDIEIEGCLSAATAIISMDVQLDTPDNHKYEQSYIAGGSDVMKQTDDCHGQPGYEVELDIDSYTTGFAYSMRSLGEYEVTVTVHFEDGSETELDVMTVDVVSQVAGLLLKPVLENRHVNLVGSYHPMRDDRHRVTSLPHIQVLIDGYGEVGGPIASQTQTTNDNGYSGFTFITEYVEITDKIGEGGPLIIGETYDYKVVSTVRGLYDVVLDEGEVTLQW